MNSRILFIVVSFLLVVGVISVRFFLDSSPTSTPSPTSNTSAVPVNGSMSASWKEYISDTQNFSIKYPSEMEVREQNGVSSFALLGPTQSLGTEVYDGIIINISSRGLEGKTLKKFAEEEHQVSKNEPLAQNVTNVEAVTVNGMRGYQFRVSGLGEFQNIYLPEGEGGYFLITYLIEDPTGKGFRQIINSMLSTFYVSQQ